MAKGGEVWLAVAGVGKSFGVNGVEDAAGQFSGQ